MISRPLVQLAFVRQRKKDFASLPSPAFCPFANEGKEDRPFALDGFWNLFS